MSQPLCSQFLHYRKLINTFSHNVRVKQQKDNTYEYEDNKTNTT